MAELRNINNRDPWMLAEDIPDIDFQFSEIWLSSFVNDLEKTVGRNYRKILAIYRGYNLKFYYGKKDSNIFAKHVLDLILKKSNFGKKINKNICLYSDRLKLFSQKIKPEFLARLSNKELINFYQKLDDIHTQLYTWGWLPNAVDMFHGNFTNYLKEFLGKKLPSDEVNSAMVLLSTTTLKSVFILEHESFLRLVAKKQSGAKKAAMQAAIQKHTNKFFYLKHLWLGKDGVYNFSYYKKEIDKFINTKEDAGKLLKKESIIFNNTLEEKKVLIKKLKLGKTIRDIFDVYAQFAVTKAYRRDAQIYWAYKMDFLFRELNRRLKLPEMSIRFMFPGEIMQALEEGRVDKELKSDLIERTKFCAYYARKGIDTIYYGKDAQAIENQIIHQPAKELNELLGQCACPGRARGKIRIINRISDMKKMKPGDILVSIATNPDIVPAMKKAAAIVTEQGGITSHAAIISREMKIPCIIGTKIATKVLKVGDLVEVDADLGLLRILKPNKKNKALKAIFFDFGGVVALGGFSVFCEKMSHMLGVPKEKAMRVFQKDNFPILTADKMSVREYWEKSLRDLGREDLFKNINKYEKIYIDSYRFNKELIPLLRESKKKFFIGILSNQAKERKEILEKNLNIPEYFNEDYFSSIVGFNKSDINFFKAILEKQGLDPSECLFIDDEEPNLEKAKKLGLKTILYKNVPQLKKELA